MTKRRILLTVLGAVAVFAIAAGVSFVIVAASNPTVTTDVVRERAYSSLDDLATSSSLVVTVTASRSTVVEKGELDGFTGPATTTTTTTVQEVLGAPGAIPLLGAEPAAGDEIEIVQFGLPESLGAQSLEPGTTYLLFLFPTLIEGSDANDFLVVGTWAGIYVEADDGTYVRAVSELDALPDRMTIDEVTRALGRFAAS